MSVVQHHRDLLGAPPGPAPVTRALAAIAADREGEPDPGHDALLGALLVDTAACSLAARRAASGVAALLRAASGGGAPDERLPCLIGPVTGHAPVRSAFLDAALAHALNFDAYGAARGPAGTVVVPAALAVAPASASGADLLRALAVGVEIGNRLGAAVQGARSVHAGGAAGGSGSGGIEGQLLGTFAAAAAAGSMLGLGVEEMHSALGLALMQAAGSAQVMLDGDVPAKGFYGGFATAAGVSAALGARAGLDARCAAIEGSAGLVARFFPGGDPLRALDAPLGAPAGDLVFKRWPCSSIVAPSIGPALDLRRSVPLDAIERVVVDVPEAARPWCEPLAARRRPDNSACATNSIPFAVAVALAEGDFAPWHVGPGAAGPAGARGLAERVECRVRPAGVRTVSVVLADGTTRSAQPWADPHLDPAEVPAKLRRVARWTGVGDGAEALILLAGSLASHHDLRDLGVALRDLAPPSSPPDPDPFDEPGALS